MRALLDRLDNSGNEVPLILALVAIFIVVSLARHSHGKHDAATREMWKLRFQLAQRKAQDLFADPKIPRDDPVHFWAVKNALDIWEQWQQRPLSALEAVGDNPTEEEWHALSLINSLPSSGASQMAM